jgi:hypothetical protein
MPIHLGKKEGYHLPTNIRIGRMAISDCDFILMKEIKPPRRFVENSKKKKLWAESDSPAVGGSGRRSRTIDTKAWW